MCIFHSLFLYLQNYLREIETSVFIAGFYSEMCFKKTTYKNLSSVNIQINYDSLTNLSNILPVFEYVIFLIYALFCSAENLKRFSPECCLCVQSKRCSDGEMTQKLRQLVKTFKIFVQY